MSGCDGVCESDVSRNASSGTSASAVVRFTSRAQPTAWKRSGHWQEKRSRTRADSAWISAALVLTLYASAIRCRTAKIRVSRRSAFFLSSFAPTYASAIVSIQRRPDYETLSNSTRATTARTVKRSVSMMDLRFVGRPWLSQLRDALRTMGWKGFCVEAEVHGPLLSKQAVFFLQTLHPPFVIHSPPTRWTHRA